MLDLHPAPEPSPRRGYRLPPDQRAWHRAWQADLDQIRRHGGRPRTIDEGIALFLADLAERGRLVHTTCRDAYLSLRGFVAWLARMGATGLDELDRDHVVAYLRSLADRQYSPYYLKQIRSNLGQLARFLHGEGLVQANLVEGLRLRSPIQRIRPIRVLSRAELETLLQGPRQWGTTYRGKCPSYARWLAIRDEAVVTLLVATGVRCCEAASLDLDDIQWTRGLGVVHSKGNHLYVRPERLVFLDTPRLAAALRAWMEVRPTSNATTLFTASRGHPLLPQSFWRIVTKYARNMGLGRVTPHVLRHTFCTHLIREGVDPYTVQLLMGHRSVTYTLRWYTHLSPADLHEDWRGHHPLGREDR